MTGLDTLGEKRTQDTLDEPEMVFLAGTPTDSPLAVTLLLDVILALSQSIPEFDGLVAGARDDLPVVGAEAHGEDIGGVADKAAGGGTGVQIPEAQGVVPG